jgi:hypothetical protein
MMYCTCRYLECTVCPHPAFCRYGVLFSYAKSYTASAYCTQTLLFAGIADCSYSHSLFCRYGVYCTHALCIMQVQPYCTLCTLYVLHEWRTALIHCVLCISCRYGVLYSCTGYILQGWCFSYLACMVCCSRTLNPIQVWRTVLCTHTLLYAICKYHVLFSHTVYPVEVWCTALAHYVTPSAQKGQQKTLGICF